MMKINHDARFSLGLVVEMMMSIVTGVLVSLLLTVLVMIMPGAANAADGLPGMDKELVRKNDVTSGSVLFKTGKSGFYRLAPRLKTDVHMRINGMIVRTKVVQRFTNPGKDWVEGVYVFPLPEKAAVDHLRMRIGDRIIEGRIKERGEAKKIYTKARAEGRKASLIEQERPNIFTNSIANIGPGETISVEIEYQQSLRFDHGQFRLRFPLVVAPRYIPGNPVPISEEVSKFTGTGWAVDTTRVKDASRITPPVQNPAREMINPVSIRIELDAGFPMVSVQSTYHKITKTIHSSGKATLILQDGEVPADRDFELVWQPDRGQVPRAALFTEKGDKNNYMMLMVMPPDVDQTSHQVLSREVIYVIDTSGSMGGESIRQARRALEFAVRELKSGDYFNVIQFNSITSKLFSNAVPADQMHISRAMQYIDSLRATGGTEMAGALHAALDSQSETGLLRQVIFLTDGSIGNEDALFSIIKTRLAKSRLFTVGIGSAPNSHFMRKAALYGRGSYTYIGKIQEVDGKMSELFRKIQQPVLTNLKIEWPNGIDVEMWPERLPDLYAGEPLVITARLSEIRDKITIKGRRLQQDWKVSIPLVKTDQSYGVGILWAREKISSLINHLREGISEEVVRKGIIDLSLEHHLVSKYTSLVAVDTTPTRPLHDVADKIPLKVNLPAGWKYQNVFTTLPQTATDSYLNLLVGLLLILLGCLLSLYSRVNRHEA